jgi:hypothetical protein
MPLQTIVERLAHYLANRSGLAADDAAVIDEAASILALLKDPDPAMEAVGDGDMWRRMIDAALIERWKVPGALAPAHSPPEAGSDEEGDVPVHKSNIQQGDAASWVHVKDR